MTKRENGAHLVHQLQRYLDRGYFSLIDEYTPPTTNQRILSNIPKQIVLFGTIKTHLKMFNHV